MRNRFWLGRTKYEIAFDEFRELLSEEGKRRWDQEPYIKKLELVTTALNRGMIRGEE